MGEGRKRTVADDNDKSGRLDKDEQTNAQLVALVQNAWDLFEFAKTQQWRVTNYALLLFAAIVWISQKTKFQHLIGLKIALITAVVLVLGFAIKVICDSHKAQTKAWTRTKACAQEYFSESYQEIWNIGNTDDRAKMRRSYAIFLVMLIVVGAASAIWFVLCET